MKERAPVSTRLTACGVSVQPDIVGGVAHPIAHPSDGIRWESTRLNETRAGAAQAKHDRTRRADPPTNQFLNRASQVRILPGARKDLVEGYAAEILAEVVHNHYRVKKPTNQPARATTSQPRSESTASTPAPPDQPRHVALRSDPAARASPRCCFTAAGMDEAATSLNRQASPTMNGLRRSGQLALPPLARRLSVVAAERRGKGVRRGVAGPAGDLVEGQFARPQVIAGEGHPPVC
jgi:hypothetical protein